MISSHPSYIAILIIEDMMWNYFFFILFPNDGDVATFGLNKIKNMQST